MNACAVCGIDGLHACPGPTPIDNSGFNLAFINAGDGDALRSAIAQGLIKYPNRVVMNGKPIDYPLLDEVVQLAIREYKAGKTKPL